ncbi:MAG TPA: hypothetical protein VMW58_09285 [Anaerolineae bacterium]|nr:hypothetical protein [Anaerolineae bacterium]
MAEPKDEERKPFITFSFTEEGAFDRYAGIYLHLPLEKPPTGEEIAIMVGTIKTYAKCFAELQGKGVVARLQESEEPPQDEPLGVQTVEGNRPLGGASEPQCKKILAICHKADGKMVEELLANYAGAEWRSDKNGHCLPEWDFLRSLTLRQASTIIERLERAES